MFQCDHLRKNREARIFIQEKAPELIVVVAFGQILDREFFSYPRLGALNIHASLLPKYRGASPIIKAILSGERETGVSIMKINEEMDTGDILAQERVPIEPNITAGELTDILAQEGAQLMMDTIPDYVRGDLEVWAQDDRQSSTAPRITKKQARIDWRETAHVIHNQVRALNPWPVALTSFRGGILKVWRTEKTNRPPENVEILRHPGRTCRSGDGGIIVECGKGTFLLLKELQIAGRKRISAAEFRNGIRLLEGEILE